MIESHSSLEDKIQCVHAGTGTFRFRGDLGYFSVNKEFFLAFLKDQSQALRLTQARVCFHESNASLLQLMLVYHSTRHNVRRHLHPDKDEYLQIIRGSMSVRFYGEDEDVINSVTLCADSESCPNDFLCFVQRGVLHDVVINEDAYFLEVTTGPFHDRSTKSFLD
jgi:cupin fold WbuC family metalloprotein